MGTKMAAEWTS